MVSDSGSPLLAEGAGRERHGARGEGCHVGLSGSSVQPLHLAEAMASDDDFWGHLSILEVALDGRRHDAACCPLAQAWPDTVRAMLQALSQLAEERGPLVVLIRGGAGVWSQFTV